MGRAMRRVRLSFLATARLGTDLEGDWEKCDMGLQLLCVHRAAHWAQEIRTMLGARGVL